jgi:phenylacetate-CoA ligase
MGQAGENLATIGHPRATPAWPPVYDPSFSPSDDAEYWNRELECADAATRDAVVLQRLVAQVEYAWQRSAFYRRKWQAAGVSPDTLSTLDDLAKFPVIRKEDLRASQAAYPPFGDYLCIEPAEIARVHGTSGTTGRPTGFAIGRQDWARIGEAHARAMWAGGLRPRDRIIICSFFSLYMGSWGALHGAERLGASVFPFGAGLPGQTLRATEWARDVRATAFYGTPSYALHFAETARRAGIDPRSFGLRTLFFSGEPGAGIPATKKLIEATFDGICVDMGSMAEMTPWMSNAECRFRTGMHLWQDIVFTQVCNQETYAPVPFGEEGTPVYTHLARTSQPMIRLLSNDLARWTDEPCPCGRTYPRLPFGIYGRADDVIIIRGAKVYPNAIEDTLRAIEGCGAEFRVIVSRVHSLDEMRVEVECDDASNPASGRQMQHLIADRLRARLGVRIQVELLPPGTLPATEFKARRVIDQRRSIPPGSGR